MLFIPVSGEEQNRGLLRPRAAADQFRGFEAVHIGHPDIQQNGREVVVEKMPERLLSGVRQHQFFAQAVERGSDGDQVLRRVVHQKDFHPLF